MYHNAIRLIQCNTIQCAEHTLFMFFIFAQKQQEMKKFAFFLKKKNYYSISMIWQF